jgi:hypothetical protein
MIPVLVKSVWLRNICFSKVATTLFIFIFEFRHFRPHYLDVDTIFGDLRRECLHQRVVRNTIFRKAPPSVVSGYGKRSIHLNRVVATFEKHEKERIQI